MRHPFCRMLLRIGSEDVISARLVSLLQELACEDMRLECVCLLQSLCFERRRLALLSLRIQYLRFGQQILETLLDLDRPVHVLRRIIQIAFILEQISRSIIPAIPGESTCIP